MELTALEMFNVLKTETCQVKFTKVNGDVRDMTCTLRPDLIPVSDSDTETMKKNIEIAIPVFDLNADGWRSFKPGNVTEFSILS